MVDGGCRKVDAADKGDGRSEKQLHRPSLGRVAFIGELYDVRSESLSSLSLMRSFPQSLIKHVDVAQMEFQYKFTESISDRFELMDVGAEVQLSVLLGLIKLEGSGKFLKEEKKLEKSVSCSLVCQIRTVNEKIFASFDEILKYVDLTLLEDPQYTHVITEINWGANCLFTLEFACESESSKRDIEGRLAAELSVLKAITFTPGGKLEKIKSSLLNREEIDIKVHADVVPDSSWPTTVEGFFEFVEDVPQLLKRENNGKGKPLSYTMIPLSTILKLLKLEITTDVCVRKIHDSFVSTTIFFFEEITTVKQKLQDLLTLFYKNKKFVREEYLKRTRETKKQLSIEESKMKLFISQNWVAVRSGKKTLKDLVHEVERFKRCNISLDTYEAYVESCSPIVQKLTTISKYISQGVTYLGNEESFTTVQNNRLTDEFIVLVTSSEFETKDQTLSEGNTYYFLTLVADRKPNTKYVVVDFDLAGKGSFFNDNITTTKCFHIKGNRVLSGDMFADYVAEMESHFVRLKEDTKMEYCQHKPANRVVLEMVCPGFDAGTCSNDVLEWKCYGCKTNIEYGFDQFYYCKCGKSSASFFEYRCGRPKHGNTFIPTPDKFLSDALSALRPLKELNLLLLGESGVGKSTWINSIVNYLSFESFDDAKEQGVICTIPASYVFYDPETYEKYVINIGQNSDNENTNVGQSATQNARTYNLLWQGRCLRLIDTPGLGDTRGVEQDKINLRKIIDHLAYMREIHGVCILLRANRMSTIFKYCIKELLVHLHRSVVRNIVFCFTMSRNSLYSPGQTAAILDCLIKEMGIQDELVLGKHNMFPLDNEAFMFMCSLTNPAIKHDEVVEASFRKSWEVSSNETRRLFETVKTFPPHLLEATLSLVKVRSRILALTKPIAEISKTIQINVSMCESKQKEITNSELTLEDLRKKLQVTEIHLESISLKYPRTVCTSKGCVDYIRCRTSDVTEIQYKTHCHPQCYLENVIAKTTNNADLRGCTAMSNGVCKVCKCSWSTHMHITYDQRRVERTTENQYIKDDMEKEEFLRRSAVASVESLKSLISKYKEEQEIIIQAAVKLGMFLKKNAITAYNDSVASYLRYLIEEEEKKPERTKGDEEILKNLKNMLDHYNAEVSFFQQLLDEDPNKQEEITTEDVMKIEQELYNLELTGKQIRESAEACLSSSYTFMEYTEVAVEILPKTKKSMRKGFRSFLPSFLRT